MKNTCLLSGRVGREKDLLSFRLLYLPPVRKHVDRTRYSLFDSLNLHAGTCACHIASGWVSISSVTTSKGRQLLCNSQQVPACLSLHGCRRGRWEGDDSATLASTMAQVGQLRRRGNTAGGLPSVFKDTARHRSVLRLQTGSL